MDDRIEIIERGWELFSREQYSLAVSNWEEAYLGGEETSQSLILGYARALKEVGKVEKSRYLLMNHVRLFETYRDFLSAASLVETIDRKLVKTGYHKQVKIAVLSDATISYFNKIFTYVLKSTGIDPEIYEAPFGQLESEILSENSQLYRFNPDIVLIILSGREIMPVALLENTQSFIEKKFVRLRNLWDALRQRCDCQVLQGNYVTGPYSPAPNAAGSLPEGSVTAIRLLNSHLARSLPQNVVLLDMDALAAEYGRRAWWDNHYYYAAKLPFAQDAIPLAVRHITGVLKALLGLSPKVVVIDLDNTVWGGILGEDGLLGIELGPTPEGEPFLDFQRYLKGLQETGVLLAVCSKNDSDIVREVFEKHEHMVLRVGDIAAWRVNWQPKTNNIKEIARELNLGMESFVFLDDNPAEREEVRKRLPWVSVPVLPPDPSRFVSDLVKMRLFERIAISEEDRKRTRLYQQIRKAKEFQESAPSHEEFLRGLNMRARVEYCSSDNISRIEQLVNKTNQFNLTTKRMTRAEIESAAANPDSIVLGFYLEDRLGKHGLTGVLVARKSGKKLLIDNFLLSCRVIGRGLETVMLDILVREARKKGYDFTVLQGTYIPTKKNSLVENLYDDLGFNVESKEKTGKTYRYMLQETEDFSGHFIEVSIDEAGRDENDRTLGKDISGIVRKSAP